jgi:hypothetical protein
VMNRPMAVPAALLCASAALMPAIAGAQGADSWAFTGSLNLYLPTMSGSTTFAPGSGGGSGASVDVGTILESLQFTFMGSLEARKGPWGLFTDVVYLDLGAGKSGSRSLSLGGVELPAGAAADVHMDLVGWSWTLGGSYRALSTPDLTFDLVAGARLLDIEQKLNWTLTGNVGSVGLADRAGSSEVRLRNWDAVIGVKGRFVFGEDRKWFAPYYLDVGTGDSDRTVQAMAGLGYSFGWGDVVGAWRYLDYTMKPAQPVQDLNFNGPMISAVFHW